MPSTGRSAARSDDMAAQVVLGHLGRGRDAAQPLSAIAESLNWPRRAVEAAVQQLRLDGHAVASDGSGVWLGDANDMEATAATLRSRLVSQYRTWKAVRRTAKRLRHGEQMELWRAA